MNKLTKQEMKLVDEFVIRNDYKEFSEPHFFSILHQIVPDWRLEQLANNRVYTHEPTVAYSDYIKNLITHS